MREGTESSDRVVEGSVNLHGLGDHVLDLLSGQYPGKQLGGGGVPISYLLELVQLELALGVLRGADGHAGKQGTERLYTVRAYSGSIRRAVEAYRNAVPLTNTEYRHIDMGSTSLQGGVGVRHGTRGIVVEMRLDIAS